MNPSEIRKVLGLALGLLGLALAGGGAGILAGEGPAPAPSAPQGVKSTIKLVPTVLPVPVAAHFGPWAEKPVPPKTRCAGGILEKPQTAFIIADLDGNGRFGDLWSDGLLFMGSRFLLPLEEVTWFGDHQVKFLAVSPDGSEIQLEVTPVEASDVQLAVLRQINAHRVSCGLPPRGLNPELTRACQAHCHYCAINNYFGHPEDKSKPGYTPEGHNAGMASIIHMGMTPEGAVGGFLATFLHRIDLIWPDTNAYGAGSEGRITAINGRVDRRKNLKWGWPVPYPAEFQEGMGLAFAPESPNPIPNEATSPCGFPVTLTFASGKVRGCAAKVFALGNVQPGADWKLPEEGGTEVPGFLSTPEKPAVSMFGDNLRTICLIPKEPLAANCWHRAEFSWQEGGAAARKVWFFKTGAHRLPPRRR